MKNFIQFAKDKKGATITMFALTIVPAILFGGLALEYSFAIAHQSRLQAALDSATIAAAALPSTTSDSARITVAEAAFQANMAQNGSNANATFAIANKAIQGSASMPVDAILSKIIGNNQYTVGTKNEVKFKADEKGEIVLVLDYSSSMNSNGKWQAMRDAAINLVNKVSANATKPDIKFALAPFAKMVRTTMPSDYIIGETPGETWTGCTQDRKWPHNTTDGTPIATNDDTKWGLLPTAEGTCHEMAPHNLTLKRLTNDIPAVLAQLNAMDPYIGTAISLGLSFGWHLISPGAPFADGVAYNTPGTLKAIILLSDGRQSTKAWGPGLDLSKSNGENNLETTCANIKAKDVLMITIAFDIQDTATETRLKNCATSSQYYFDADTNGQLAIAFDRIASLLTGKLYVSK